MPSWKDLKRFCERDGWELYKQTDHYFFRKTLKNGDILRTKVSMGSGQIGNHLWAEILKRQLKVDQSYFNKII